MHPTRSGTPDECDASMKACRKKLLTLQRRSDGVHQYFSWMLLTRKKQKKKRAEKAAALLSRGETGKTSLRLKGMEAEVEEKKASLPLVTCVAVPGRRLKRIEGLKARQKCLQSSAPPASPPIPIPSPVFAPQKFDHRRMRSCLCRTQSCHLHNHHTANSYLHIPHVTENRRRQRGEKQSREHPTGLEGNLRSGDGERTQIGGASICSAGLHLPTIWRALAVHVRLWDLWLWTGGGVSVSWQ